MTIGTKPFEVKVVPYDSGWPLEFEAEASRLREGLGDDAQIEHVGSTAVPGLHAKPILDILVSSSRVNAGVFRDRLILLGYVFRPDDDVAGREFFSFDSEGMRRANLSVADPANEFWSRHIAFRDCLRAHPELVREYSDLKLALAAQYQKLSKYTEGKSSFVQSVLELATKERLFR